MKVTFVEELEARRAWSAAMCCPECDDYHYIIHHQTYPETSMAWWISCNNCGFEGEPGPIKEVAIGRWKQERNK